MTERRRVPQQAEGHLQVYAHGLVHLSVCTDLPDDELVRRVNIEEPTGLDHGWEISPEPFADGHSNPTPCEQGGENRRHVLLVC